MGKGTSSQWLSPNFFLVLKVWDMIHVEKVFYCIKNILLINYREKHPVKVHVWAGIRIRGRTGVCIFDGIMRAPLYAEILKETLLPFINRFCPDHRYMQDNNPKHTSRLVNAFFDSNGVNWWRMPPESPDANPIENLWHELKEFIRREVKPKNQGRVGGGIKRFWLTVDATKCQKYI